MCLICVLNRIVRRQPFRLIKIIQQILDSSEVMCPLEEDPVSPETNSRLDERGSKSKRRKGKDQDDQGEDITREGAPKKKRKDGPRRTVTDCDRRDEPFSARDRAVGLAKRRIPLRLRVNLGNLG